MKEKQVSRKGIRHSFSRVLALSSTGLMDPGLSPTRKQPPTCNFERWLCLRAESAAI
jgi:hypothetical protein